MCLFMHAHWVPCSWSSDWAQLPDVGAGNPVRQQTLLTISSSPWSVKHDALAVGLCFSWSFVSCVVCGCATRGSLNKGQAVWAWLLPQSLCKHLFWVRTFTPGKILQLRWRPRKSLHSALLWEDIWWEQSIRILEKQMMGSCYLLIAVLRWSAHIHLLERLIVSVHRNYWNARLCFRIFFFW